MAIGGLLIAGWFIFTQHRALAAEAAALEAARTRILALEERLNMTAETLNQTGENTSEKIDFWESEIRKLWDVVNKRNMDLIKGNAAAIAKVDKAVGELDGTVAELNAGFGRHESAFARQEQMVDQITNLGAQMQQVPRPPAGHHPEPSGKQRFRPLRLLLLSQVLRQLLPGLGTGAVIRRRTPR